MSKRLTPTELQTTRYLHELSADFMRLLSEHFGGETTLNHLRIGNYIGLNSHYLGQPTSNKDIAAALGISRPTVSRIVGDFIDQGWVVEKPHPDDGRRRLLQIAPGHPAADRFEKVFRGRINDLLQRYDRGEVVQVDPSRKSY